MNGIILFIVALVMTWSTAVVAASFSDIPNQFRAKKEIDYVTENGIMRGKTATTFDPHGGVTRGEAAAVIARSLGVKEGKVKTSFSDVGQTHPFSNYIQVLSERKIINGYGDGTFKPNQQLTRGEIVRMINNAYFTKGLTPSKGAEHLISLGIAQGKSAGEFGFAQPMIRADFAVFIARTLETSLRIQVENTQPKPPATQTYSLTKYVDTGAAGLNIRKGPSTQHAIAFTLAHGMEVKAGHAVNGWHPISHNGKTGYASAAFLKDTNPIEVAPPPAKEKVKYVYVSQAGVSANVRSGPGTGYQIVFKLPSKEQVKIISEVSGWSEIEHQGRKGYISNSLLVNDLPLPPSSPKRLQDELIMIDPGHGGKDPGALGVNYKEATATLAISKYAKRYFDASPFQVKMTRTDDTHLELEDRVAFANRNKASLFLSVHINSFTNPSASGLETYYYSATGRAAPSDREQGSKQLASFMQYRATGAWPDSKDRGVKTAAYYVIRFTSMPAVLLEAGFISNADELKKISSPVWQEKMGRAVYLATLDYYYHYHDMKQETLPLYEKLGEKPARR